MIKTHNVVVPFSNAKMRTLSRQPMKGCGYGAVLLDNGMGGQSSYHSVDHYMETTGRNPYTNKIDRPAPSSGKGLADKIASSLSKLNIYSKVESKPKRKNISMNI